MLENRGQPERDQNAGRPRESLENLLTPSIPEPDNSQPTKGRSEQRSTEPSPAANPNVESRGSSKPSAASDAGKGQPDWKLVPDYQNPQWSNDLDLQGVMTLSVNARNASSPRARGAGKWIPTKLHQAGDPDAMGTQRVLTYGLMATSLGVNALAWAPVPSFAAALLPVCGLGLSFAVSMSTLIRKPRDIPSGFNWENVEKIELRQRIRQGDGPSDAEYLSALVLTAHTVRGNKPKTGGEPPADISRDQYLKVLVSAINDMGELVNRYGNSIGGRNPARDAILSNVRDATIQFVADRPFLIRNTKNLAGQNVFLNIFSMGARAFVGF